MDPFMRNNPDLQSRTKQQNRSNVLQMKLIGSSHPTGLTNNLLKLFEARPPLEFKAPPEKRKCPPYTGMAQFVSNFAEKGDSEYQPPVMKGETQAQKKARIHKLRLEEGARKVAEELEKYDPQHNPDATGDPYKTLFVSRLNYETSESKIKREFEAYGPIKRFFFDSSCAGGATCLGAVQFKVRLVTDKSSSKPRGYAFIEYMHTRDMKSAYKQGDGRKIDGRRVLVDVERGRTVPNWRPRRLGGGLGTSRISAEDSNPKVSGRESRGASKSEEPRTQEDRHVDREKSRERGREREKEREKSRERSHDQPRDRDLREDRHHRDRDRTRDRDRERESRRDRDRTRDRERGRDHGRDRDRDRPREREREREKEHEVGDIDQERGHSKDRNYDHVDSKRDRDRHRDRDHEDHEYDDRDRGRGQYGDLGHDRYDQMEYDEHYDRATSEHLEKESAQDMDQEY